jgi:hypothetical protein
MQAGATFYLSRKAADGHLWVVISDPLSDPERVLFTSMTSHDVTKESVCVIEGSEHENLKHKTCIAYEYTKCTTLQNLNRLIEAGELRPQSPVSLEILARIRRGASLSKRIEFRYIEILCDQDLLD